GLRRHSRGGAPPDRVRLARAGRRRGRGGARAGADRSAAGRRRCPRARGCGRVSEIASPSRTGAADPLFIEALGNGITLEMVSIPGGTFLMGAPDDEPDSNGSERPQHRVTVPPLSMGRYVVTIAQWRAVMGELPEGIMRLDPRFGSREDLPVVRVCRIEADAFCTKLWARTGRP